MKIVLTISISRFLAIKFKELFFPVDSNLVSEIELGCGRENGCMQMSKSEYLFVVSGSLYYLDKKKDPLSDETDSKTTMW